MYQQHYSDSGRLLHATHPQSHAISIIPRLPYEIEGFDGSITIQHFAQGFVGPSINTIPWFTCLVATTPCVTTRAPKYAPATNNTPANTIDCTDFTVRFMCSSTSGNVDAGRFQGHDRIQFLMPKPASALRLPTSTSSHIAFTSDSSGSSVGVFAVALDGILPGRAYPWRIQAGARSYPVKSGDHWLCWRGRAQDPPLRKPCGVGAIPCGRPNEARMRSTRPKQRQCFPVLPPP
jgi:hypothetical protein